MNRYLQETDITEWMTLRKTNLIEKKKPAPKKETAPNNYRHDDEENTSGTKQGGDLRFVISCELFPEEQKGSQKWSRGIGEFLYNDQTILNKCKKRRKNLARAWIDNKKAYCMVPQRWIISSLKMH